MLTWSAFALSDRDAVFTYIQADNPSAAILIDERIVAATRRLIDFLRAVALAELLVRANL